MSNQSIIRITRELGEIQRSSDLSLAVACRDIDVRNLKALIVGPPDTPYEFGFFEFTLRFGKEYPAKAPTVQGVTTNSGRCRFNPNIYASGRVCLSILGTWRGERGEEWSSAQGLESILISIQSLMSSNPYENEPGFEDAKTDLDKKNITNYVAKICHETLRISVIQRLEDYLGIQPDGTMDEHSYRGRGNIHAEDVDEDGDASSPSFEPHKDLIKQRFLWYYDTYLHTIQSNMSLIPEDESFVKMPFESSSNGMDGKFRYGELERRLLRIRTQLDSETQGWGAEGRIQQQQDSGVAANLQRQFEQAVEVYKRDDRVTLDIGLVEGNPFVWQLTYFGRPMTNLDGGLFKIKILMSPRFPDELPRVRFETPLFHQRISKDGVVCYFATRPEDIKSHIEAVIEALEEESPPYDPRTMVHPEASKLFWGSTEDRKEYHRRLRRAVQRSLEDC